MGTVYRLFGNELSPYSVKVRSYLRFKGIPHQWIVRNPASEAEFARYAKLPLIPLLISPDDEAFQDSTLILEGLEAHFNNPSIYPEDPALQFLSALLEEYADEWVNKPMFHYRWYYDQNAASAAERLAEQLFPDSDRAGMIPLIRERMVSRLVFVGSSADTKEVIEESFHRLTDLLNSHLRERKYLFGERPALADFGLFGQLYQCLSDPTPGNILRQRAPHVVAWIERMSLPEINGPFAKRDELFPALEPLLREEVGKAFVPWTLANEHALRAGLSEFALCIHGCPFRQVPQKYHAKSLAALRKKYQAVATDDSLRALLEKTGCLTALQH